MDEAERVNVRQAQAFLASYLDTEPSEVALIGEGAWSRCFGFRRGDEEEELVIRFGNYLLLTDSVVTADSLPWKPKSGGCEANDRDTQSR